MRCHSYDVIMEGNVILGGYCAGVPPLPIPNREVKPGCADGTAMQCGRVGGRLLFSDEDPADTISVGSFCLCGLLEEKLGDLGNLRKPWFVKRISDASLSCTVHEIQ